METTVRSVMTTDVVTVGVRTPFKEIVEVLRRRGVHAVPVLDTAGWLCGVVSSADLLLKEADPTSVEEQHRLAGRRRRRELRKAAGTVAAELMTSPAVTTTPDATVEAAAREMRRHHVGRLPVVDPKTGRMVGIVSRCDVLGVYGRPDGEIEREIIDELLHERFAMDPARFGVTVRDGRVSIDGRVERRSLAATVLHEIRHVEGVVSAVSHLDWDVDDTITDRYTYM